MKRNTDNKQSPQTFQKAQSRRKRPPNNRQQGRAPSQGHAPVPLPKPGTAGRRQRKAEHKTASEHTKAPTAPRPGGGTDSSSPAGVSPRFRGSGSGFGYRTPERCRPRRCRPEPRTLRAETKTRPGPFPLPSPCATQVARPGTPWFPSGARNRFSRSKPGERRPCLGDRDSLSKGGIIQRPFLPNSTGARGAALLPALSPAPAGAAESRSAAPLGDGCGTRGHSPRRSHAGASGVKAAGAASPAGERTEPDAAHGHSSGGPTSSGTPRASTARNINFPALSVVAKSLGT